MDRDALIAAVRRQTNLTTSDVSDADVINVLDEGIREVCSNHKWDFLFKRATLSTTADTIEISLPADFQSMGLVQQIGLSNGPLMPISFDEYSYRTGDNPTSSSQARYFYLRYDNGTAKIGLYPTPSATASDNYEIFYYKQPAVLTTAATEPEWDSGFHNLLVDYAAYRLWEREEYFQESERAMGRYIRRFMELKRFYRQRNEQVRMIIGDGNYYRGHRNFRIHLGFE